MTESPRPDPEPPRPPGVPDLDVELPFDPDPEAVDRDVPGNEDVGQDAGAVEPPD